MPGPTAALHRHAADALAAAEPRVLWLDRPGAPGPAPALEGERECDLAIVGAGFTGMWTALLAKRRRPQAEVVLLEGTRAGDGASGRNGGFCDPSLTHGLANGLARFAAEIGEIERLGAENFAAYEADLERLGIECDWQRSGSLEVATEEWQLAGLREEAEAHAALGQRPRILSAPELQDLVRSPTYAGGVRYPDRAIVDPGKLARGLRAACLQAGVALYEGTEVTKIAGRGSRVCLEARAGRVLARSAAIATNAFPPLLRRIRAYTLPVYDYVLATEPLGAERRAALGWAGREGVSDAANQFHYYRLTADERIVWGGYDAVYHFANGMRPELEQRQETFLKLASHFFQTFPQLEGTEFSHRWGGAIDTCSRFSAMWGRALGGRVAYCVGFTGLGVVASRFGGAVMLDLLEGQDSERTRLRMVKEKPLPFPPEPLRSAVVGATRRSLAAADRNGGRRNAWLRLLDRLGLGFDS